MVLERIRAWNERTAKRWEQKYGWYGRSRQWARDGVAENNMKLDAIANAQGYESYAEKRAVKRKAKKGYRLCVTCGSTVRPQAPWNFGRIVTLSLLTPGKHECPKCKGVDFAEPR